MTYHLSNSHRYEPSGVHSDPVKYQEWVKLFSEAWNCFKGQYDRTFPDEDQGNQEVFVEIDDDLGHFKKRVYISGYSVDKYTKVYTLGVWRDRLDEVIEEYGSNAEIKPSGGYFGGPPYVVRMVPLTEDQKQKVAALREWTERYYAERKAREDEGRLMRDIQQLEAKGYIVTKKEDNGTL